MFTRKKLSKRIGVDEDENTLLNEKIAELEWNVYAMLNLKKAYWNQTSVGGLHFETHLIEIQGLIVRLTRKLTADLNLKGSKF